MPKGGGVLKLYVRITGMVLVILGLLGLGALLRLSTGTSLFQLVLGAFFAYLGFWQRDQKVVRSVVGGMGVLLLGAGVILLASWFVSDDPAFLGPIQLTCLIVGSLSITASRWLGDGQGPSA